MPLYEYKCDACGNQFEKIVKFSDPPVDACPACGGAVQKLLSSPAIQFKGSGWYITDYARKSPGDSSSGSKASGGKSESGTSDSKTSESSAESSTTTAPAAASGSTPSKDSKA